MLEETLGQVSKPRIYLSIQYKHDLTGQIYGKLHPKAIRYKHHLLVTRGKIKKSGTF